MEHIKIENTWDTVCNVNNCDCMKGSIYVNRTNFGGIYNTQVIDIFTDKCIYNISKEPHNLIITRSYEKIDIFDINENKVILSTKNINDVKSINAVLIMDTFMIIRYSHHFSDAGGLYSDYMIYNFDTKKHKIFTDCKLYVNNNKTVFLFELNVNKQNQLLEQIFNIITTDNIDDCMEIKYNKSSYYPYNDSSISYHSRVKFKCICDSNILVFEIQLDRQDYQNIETNYYDVKSRKIIYKSKYSFLKWIDTKIVEYDKILQKCNLVLFVNRKINKLSEPNDEYKNCVRCLDKYIPSLNISNDIDRICNECIDKQDVKNDVYNLESDNKLNKMKYLYEDKLNKMKQYYETKIDDLVILKIKEKKQIKEDNDKRNKALEKAQLERLRRERRIEEETLEKERIHEAVIAKKNYLHKYVYN